MTVMIPCDECKHNTGVQCVYDQDHYGKFSSAECDWFDLATPFKEQPMQVMSNKILCSRCKFAVDDKCEKLRLAYNTKKAKKCQDFMIKLPLANVPALFKPNDKALEPEVVHKVSPPSPKKIETDDICLLMYA